MENRETEHNVAGRSPRCFRAANGVPQEFSMYSGIEFMISSAQSLCESRPVGLFVIQHLLQNPVVGLNTKSKAETLSL